MNQLSRVAALGYLVLEVSDLDRWEHLVVNVIGLQIGRKEPGKFITLRMDGYEQRLILTQGPLDDVKAFGWEVANEEALEGVVRQIEAAGIPIEEASKEEADDRFVRRFFRCKDYDGNQVEIYYAPRVSRRPFVSPVVEHGFVTGQQGLGHYVHVVKNDQEKTLAFYKKLLGLSIADHVRQTFPSGTAVDVAFMHCHNKRHHTVAAFKFPEVKKQIHHFMIEVNNQQDFGRIHDLCRDEGFPMMMSVGMHPNSHALSFYIQSPSGFGFEISWGGVLIGPDWTVREYDLLDSWGHEWGAINTDRSSEPASPTLARPSCSSHT